MLISGEKMLMLVEMMGCTTWFTYFLDLPKVRYNCLKFHHYGIYLTDFTKGVFLPPLPLRSVSSHKKIILNNFKMLTTLVFIFFLCYRLIMIYDPMYFIVNIWQIFMDFSKLNNLSCTSISFFFYINTNNIC